MNYNNENNNEGIDLSGTLKDSGSGVKFEEEWQHSARSFNSENPKIIKWVIKYSGGYIKDEKQASYVLIGFVAVAIIISLFFLFSGGGSSDTELRQQKLYPPGSPAIQ